MLCMRMVTFPPAFFAVTSYNCKLNAVVIVILLQVCKVNFSE